MGRFDRQIATAKRLVKENGQAVVWRKYSDAAPSDPDKPWKPGETSYVEYNVYIVFLNINRTTEKFLQYVSGTELASGFLRGLMANEDFVPSLKDEVIRGNEVYKIKNLDTVSPNGQAIMHKIEFDRVA